MEVIVGLKLLALQAVMAGFQRMYHYHSQPLWVESVEVVSSEKIEGKDNWNGKKYVFAISALSRNRIDSCRAEISVVKKPAPQDFTVGLAGWCRSPVDVLYVNGFADSWQEMNISVFSSDNPNSLEIDSERRLPLTIYEFPVAELEQRVNQRVQVRLKDWHYVEGSLNYYGPGATRQGDNFVIIDGGQSTSVHISEIAQAWAVDRRRQF
ncbi:MAG: hypothetical protein P4L74_01575 [Candidatus Doudnabacteria bacterium]|nr:hypothetical protein [Candidatus Doudnabacteria bacterium]